MKLCCVNCGCEMDTSPKVGALNHWHFYSLYILSLVEALSPQTLHWARKRFGTNQSPCTPYKVHSGRSLSVEKKRQGNGLILWSAMKQIDISEEVHDLCVGPTERRRDRCQIFGH